MYGIGLEGDEAVNVGLGVHVSEGVYKGWTYHHGIADPAGHSPCPDMTEAEADDVVAVAKDPGKSQTDWLNEHPGAVKTWLQGLSQDDQDDCYLSAQKAKS